MSTKKVTRATLRLRDPVYHADITVLIMPSTEWRPYFKRHYRYDLKEFDGMKGMHLSIYNKSRNWIKHFILLDAWGWTCADMGGLAHEILHCCLSIFGDARIPQTSETGEPLAYYFDSLLTQAFWKLRRFYGRREKKS